MFPQFKSLNLPEIDQQVLEFWTKDDTFTKSISERAGRKPYVFYEGPPSANGLPGIHHVLARTIKDIFCRYKTMKGFQVMRKAGWDTHGLPIELAVEKELGITKENIGKTISVEEYNAACKKTVMRYTDIWNDITRKMGYWVNMDDPYITYTPKYMETVWWLLKKIYDKGLMYKGYTIQPYSPMAGTGLSSNEVNQPGSYQDVTDTTIVAQFKTKQETLPAALQGQGDIHILAWTTTPWTLPSNTALTVGPKIEYALVETFNQYTFESIKVILAKNLVAKVFAGKFFEAESDEDFASFDQNAKKVPFRILTAIIGKNLEGIRYEQLLPYTLPYQNPENAFRVILGDFVTTEDGTGVVHTAPTFGADDAKVAKEAKPEVPPMLVLDDNGTPVPLVDLRGRFTKHMGEHAGKYVKNEYYKAGEAPEKSVDVEIAIRLKEENKAFKVEKYVHSYPHCWRTDKPILYYPLDSWFIKITDVRDRMYDLNQDINWKPESTGTGRFGNWLKSSNDWNLSRSRFWGIPLPIWRDEDGVEEKAIGSMEELMAEIEKSIQAGLMSENPFKGFVVGDMSEENYDKVDLHKNIVDKIVLVSTTGKPMHRESDLIDVWFDSGSVPYAQWHYPFENKEAFDNNFPADFIAEGVDQTRGWFYTLHAISSICFDSVAYKNVVSNGLVLDSEGRKMSKRLGNAVDPFTCIGKYGADATRWYMITNAQPWDNLKFSWTKEWDRPNPKDKSMPADENAVLLNEYSEGIMGIQRAFFGTLYNTYSFFALYANIDGIDASKMANRVTIKDRPEIDRWILSALNSLIKEVDAAYSEYEPTRAGRLIEEFVDEHLSNWYVRLCRRRFWKGELNEDKLAAYQTLGECLLSLSKLMAPISPFFADWLYRNLNHGAGIESHDSVHLAFFPSYQSEMVDEALEQRMGYAQKISSMTFSLRKRQEIRVRQPLQKILLPVLNDKFELQVEQVKDLILAEVNVKELQYVKDTDGLVTKSIKPNFKTLGSLLGRHMKTFQQAISNFAQADISNVEKNGYVFENEGERFELTADDFLISSEDIEGWLVTSDKGLTVALDVHISPELEEEGMARELVNRIQNMRKDTNFEVTDRIMVAIHKNYSLKDVLIKYSSYICGEVLANGILEQDTTEGLQEVEWLEEKTIWMKIDKI